MINYGFTPELLMELAKQAFRPPPPMLMPGLNLSPPPMSMPQQMQSPQMAAFPQPSPGFGLGDGMSMLGAGLRGFGGWGGSTPNGNPNDNRPLMAGGVDPRLAIDPMTGFPGNNGLLGPI